LEELSVMIQRFQIKSNLEFYCYLKAHLQGSYEVIAEPSKSYYSEWHYHYKILKEGEILREFEGDFRELEDGELVSKGKKVLQELM